jgi:cytochrome c55X
MNYLLFFTIFSLFVEPCSFAMETETVSPQRQVELENLLEQDCGSCHGSLLKGGLGPSLLPEALAGKSAEFLKITILNGRVDTAMPPWEPLLSEMDVNWLVARLLHPQQQKQEAEK